MKIVILDGYTENPGDLSWAPLEELGDLTVYDRYGTYCLSGCQHRSIPIPDFSSLSLDASFSFMQILGLFSVIPGLAQHQPAQPNRQYHQKQCRTDKYQQDFSFMKGMHKKSPQCPFF